MGRDRADYGRRGAGVGRHPADRASRFRCRGSIPMKWLLIAIMVGSTTAGEVLQAMGMRRHGEIHDFRPGAIGRALALMARNRFVIGSMACMAASFFAFMKLLASADLSFAVPVSAVSYVLETRSEERRVGKEG